MKRSRFSDERFIGILKEHQTGMTAAELCRKHGISDATFYKWRSKYGGMHCPGGKQSAAEMRSAGSKATDGSGRLKPEAEEVAC